MPESLRPGNYSVRIVAVAAGQSYSGKDRLTLTVEDVDGAVGACHLYLSSAGAVGRTRAVLKKLGHDLDVDGWDWVAIDAHLVGQEVAVTVIEKSVDGGKPFIQVDIPLEEAIVFDDAGKRDLAERIKRLEVEGAKDKAPRGRNRGAKPVITGGSPKPAPPEAPPTDNLGPGEQEVPF